MHIQKSCFTVQRDGLTLRATEFRPEGENLPIAIVSHGFLVNQRTTCGYARQLAQLGYAAYCFDFIGGGIGSKSDGRLRDMTVMTEKQDLLAVIRHVSALPYTDAADLTLMGCSQGGFVSAMVAAALGDAVRRLVLFYPALCIPDDARKGQMMLFRFDPANIPDLIPGGPLKLGGDYARCVVDMDPFHVIAAYRGPVLLIHGDQDPIVDVSYAHRAREAYGSNCQMWILPGAGHGFKRKGDADAMFLVEQFLTGKREVLTVDVRLTGTEVTKKQGYREISIPFEGQAVGALFQGQIQPGAADVQQWRGRRPIRCCADYVLQGTDHTGTECRVHVVNTAADGVHWKPTVETDSQALAFLNGADCQVFLEMRPVGPMVHIFA